MATSKDRDKGVVTTSSVDNKSEDKKASNIERPEGWNENVNGASLDTSLDDFETDQTDEDRSRRDNSLYGQLDDADFRRRNVK